MAATRAQASVEFTSPTTTTTSGRCSSSTGSKRRMISAVCRAWEAEPTPRYTSGRGRPNSSKNSWDMLRS